MKSEEEMRALLRTVLAEQAKGISVRACTLNMGKGDTKTMLRYQNKYRSLIRTNPEFVQKVRLRRQLRDTKPSRKLRGSEYNAQSCASGLPCRTMRLPRSENGSASYLRCSVR